MRSSLHLNIKTIGLFVFACLFFVFMLIFTPWTLSHEARGRTIVIERGVSPRRIARMLRLNGIIRTESGFLACARIMGCTHDLKAGRYRFQGWESHFSVLRTLTRGKGVLEKITFPEGMRASRMAGAMAARMSADSALIVRMMEDPVFCTRLNVDAPSLEGYLYPDTYLFQSNDTPGSLIERMVGRFHEMFSDSLKVLAASGGWTVHQVATLASLVEGEAVLDSERPVVAAIYINRLRRGYPLQACPTVQYLLPGPPRRLLDRDLKIESPYNTYLHQGLPPGPVNNPGISSITAVLRPSPVNYLYLVANGDGTHTFSLSLDEHNAAKRRFEKVRREVYRRSASGTENP